jgi:hypothetical protein
MAASDGQASSHGEEKSPRVPTQTLLPGNVWEMFINATSRNHDTFKQAVSENFERNIFYLLHKEKADFTI